MRLNGLNVTFRVGVDNKFPTTLIIDDKIVELWLDTRRSTRSQLHFVIKAPQDVRIIMPRTHQKKQGALDDQSERDQENFNR